LKELKNEGLSSPMADFPDHFLHTLRSRHAIIKQIRAFFDGQGYLEVETPVRVPCPCIDPYIDAFTAEQDFYLSASPEFHMKRLLALDLRRIYQITRAFRAEETGPQHSSEFTILEWYRKGTDYLGIMHETEELVKFILRDADFKTDTWQFPFPRLKISELYLETAGWDPCCTWDEDRYFRDWAEKIDPYLYSYRAVFLFDFPAPLASLSKIKLENPCECERFELFMKGLEIGNAFSELINYEEHVMRFNQAGKKRLHMGKANYIPDKEFLNAIQAGIPECGGIAIGVDRLVMALLGCSHIDGVQTFPLCRL